MQIQRFTSLSNLIYKENNGTFQNDICKLPVQFQSGLQNKKALLSHVLTCRNKPNDSYSHDNITILVTYASKSRCSYLPNHA